MLREIADTSGGKYFQVDQLDDLAVALPEMDTSTEYNSPPEPIWDVNKTLRYLAFLLPFLLLTLEWVVRKRFKLL